MGGTFHILSTPGAGTRIDIAVPLDAAAAASPAAV
jgi:chemotaxis protein histidine kinase CheA